MFSAHFLEQKTREPRLEEYLVESARSAVLYLVTLEEAIEKRALTGSFLF